HGRIFVDGTGRLIFCIAIDGSGFRVFGFRRHMRKPQRGRVGHTVVAGGVHEPNRIPWRSLVEVRGVNVTAFGELAFVPAVVLNPLPGLGVSWSMRHALSHA